MRHRLTGKSRSEYLRGPRGQYIPQTDIAKIIVLRKAGLSYREISQQTGRSVEAVMKTLHSPEAQKEFARDSERILSAYRARLLALVPQAIETLETLIQGGNPNATIRLLLGTKSLVEKTEAAVDLRQTDPETAGRSPEHRVFRGLHGHWPEEPCHCDSQPLEENKHDRA